jgi:Bacteriophage Sf6, terminase small subunit-like
MAGKSNRNDRRSGYSPKVAERICDLVAEGESLQSISEMPNMPARRTVRSWLAKHPDFERQYEIARRERTDNLVDESVAIADSVTGCTDNAAVQAARLRVDTRKWLASKLLPERFGDKVTTELTGAGGKDLLPQPQPGFDIAAE